MARVLKQPSMSDRALLRSFQAWGGGDYPTSSHRFSTAWRQRLDQLWDHFNKASCGDAWADLREEHRASARPATTKVHPTWLIKALQYESDAVKRAVVNRTEPPLRDALVRGLEIDPNDITPDVEPDNDALCWAGCLWAERLIGALPYTDDPPVVMAITRLSSLDFAKVVKVAGIVKLAFALGGQNDQMAKESLIRLTQLDRVRLAFFRRRIRKPDPRLVPFARQDLKYIDGDRRHGTYLLGLVTVGRLLQFVETRRAQWATQFLPYAVARLTRRKMKLPMPSDAVYSWESWVFESAWVRLLSEHRITGDRDWLGERREEELK